jgi:hypothetical protein
MHDGTTPQNSLAALGAHLGARGFTVDLRADGLKVTNPETRECCGVTRHASDTIACRKRDSDGGRLWFWTAWGEPIAEADHITDATVIIMGNLTDRHAGAVW